MNDSRTDQVDVVLNAAIAYAEAGLRIFPLRPLTKEPLLREWPKQASADVERAKTWFGGRRGVNIALACGPQPNGQNIVAVDIDAHHSGWDTWAALVAEHKPDFSGAVIHRTTNTGAHIFFDAPANLRNSRARLGEGIDSRGDGGYVVLPPSRVPDLNGEVQAYSVLSARTFHDGPVMAMPGWVVEGLSTPSAAPPRHPTPQNGHRMGDASPADELRRTWDWHAALAADGWRLVKTVGDDVFYARPGKTDRGHSAVVHPSGAFVVFTTEAPRQLEQIGVPTRDGTGFTVSPFQYLAAMRFGGDQAAAARSLRPVAPARAVEPDGSEPDDGHQVLRARGVDVVVPTLPESFWEGRDVLGKVRQAAQAQMVAPDAMLANLLARWATLIPPCYKLPAVVGGEGSFDFLACVVAESSGGKSVASRTSADLVRNANDRIMFDYPVGSGEGVVQAFMVDEMAETAKGTERTGRQVVGKQALHLNIDEGMAFVGQMGRRGTTILPVLCSAWSGQVLGQTNASGETRRIIPGGTVRVAAVINMQSSNAWRLWEPEVASVGFTGRVLFVSAHDPDAPALADLPDHPGVIPFPLLPIITSGVTLTYDPAITAEIRAARHGVLTGAVEIDLTASQHLLMRCKIAGVLTLQEGRQHVSEDDWRIAGELVEHSAAVVNALGALRSKQSARIREQQAALRGDSEAVAESAKERRLVASLSARIVERVPDEGVGRATLMKTLTSKDTRHRFEAALDMAVANGFISVSDGRIERLTK
jgi:hypothetical protein